MRVLIVSNMYPGRNPDFSYAGIFVKEQFDGLSEVESVHCDLHIIDGYRSKLNYIFSSFVVLFRILFGRYDVVHAHYGLSALFTLLVPFKKWRNVIVTLHGGDILVDQGKVVQVWLTKRILSRVGKVITLNEKMNDVVSEFREDYVVFPCGVDMDFFNPLGHGCRQNIVLFPGRTDREVKNYPLFKSVVEAYLKSYGPLEVVILDGFSRQQVRDYMAVSQVMLMTSISEGSPQAIKEAMSCDVAIASTDVGDVRSVLGGINGTSIFDLKESPENIAEILRAVIVSANDSKGERRKRILELGLDTDQVTKRLLVVYREVSRSVV